MKYIIGLDISTSITGITVLNEFGKVQTMKAFDTRNKNKFKTLYEKVDFIETSLAEIKRDYNIVEIFIEQNLQSFKPGLSSAKTLLTLAKFNGIISYICRQKFKVEPQYIAATTARKQAGITVKRGEKGKLVAFEFVKANEPTFVFTLTRNGNPQPSAYDMADSWVIAKAGYLTWKLKKTS